MTIKTKLLCAAAAVLAATAMTPAGAAVTYTLDALSTFQIGGITASGAYTFTVPDFIHADTTIAVADLTTCSVTTSAGPGTCLAPSFRYGLDEPTSADEVATLKVSPPGAGPNDWVEYYYYFAPGSFEHVGTYGSDFFGTDQQAILTVTATAVDEPSPLALLAAGLGAAGVLARRSRRR